LGVIRRTTLPIAMLPVPLWLPQCMIVEYEY
jgi:hypothetical protein